MLAFTVSAIGFAAMTPFLVIWGRRDAHLTGATVGLLFVAQAAGELSGGLAGGALADRFGARRILLVSTVGMALAYGSLALVSSPGLAISVIYLGGLFEAAFHPTVFAMLADLTPAPERAAGYGVLRAGSNLGTILGPVAGALIVAHARVSDVFWCSGGALLATAGIIALTLPRGSRVDLGEEAEELRDAVPGIGAIVRDRSLGLLVAGGALLAITITWWESDGLVIVRGQRPFSASTFALLLALSAAITVVLQIPVSRVSARRYPASRLAAGALVQGIGLGVLSLAATGTVALGLAVALISIGQMLYAPQLNALVSAIAPPGRGATYQAAISTAADIGTALGPLSGLALAAGLGSAPLWLLAIPLGVLGGVAGALAARRHAAGVS